MGIKFSEAFESEEPERKQPPKRRPSKPASSKAPSGARSPYAAALGANDEAEPSAPPPSQKPKRRRRRKAGKAQRAKEKSARLEQARQESVGDDAHCGGEFRQFALATPILKAVEEMGWESPSEIQRELIPLALEGHDVVGQAKTGTGKTGAFALPILQRYHPRAAEGKRGRRPVALILTPTRELALQIDDQFQQLGVHTAMRTVPIYGGAPMEPQLRALREGCDVVVGTPGRVIDHLRRRTLVLDDVSCFVLDEADRMFDLGFRDDIYWIARRLPEDEDERQTLLLSATIEDEILKLAKQVTDHPEVIRTANDEMTVSTVEQFYVAVDAQRKLGLLVHLVDDEHPRKGMVFTRTKRGADRVAQRLRDRGIDAGEIHGDLRQKRREQILKRFRNGNLHVLVATDVAARGLDIQGVTHIFNFDVPENAEDYVHRVGRTARMGQSGRAFTFITQQDGNFLTEIEKLINKVVPRYEVDGYRCEATEEERARDPRNAPRPRASDHPMAEKFSPALLSILANRRGGRGGPGRGGGGGRRGGPPRGKGGGGKGRGRGRGR